jgi:medium-chain acyl-[acyl-carrier-protein] hydrolase
VTTHIARSQWIPFGTRPDTRIRLLCMPHAGAGATVYRRWTTGLPPWIGPCPIQPPGRERRRQEAPLTDVGTLVTQLAPEVMATIRPPYAIFGHSTGALCAYELIRELRRQGGTEPVHLFIAGRRAPQEPMERTPLRNLSVKDLATTLRQLGGTPEEVLADHEVLRMIRPALEADFRVNEEYAYRPGPPLDVPITAFAGTGDAGAEPARLAAWQDMTQAGFGLHELPGGHFAIFDHAPEVLRLITAALKPWALTDYPSA